jgi:hydroxypyruvate reductase
MNADTNPSPRARARAIFATGVAAADPGRAVAGWLVRGELAAPGPGGRHLVIAVGKAALRMAEAAQAALGPVETLVVTNYENAVPHPGMTVLAAGHPVPDANGAAAARAVLERLSRAGESDRVLALISGGGSALLPAPADGISLEDKAEVNRLLLASGAGIEEMNLVRQNLSRLKGGGFVRAASPARVTALILSDVVGDDLRVIASGPTVAPIGGREAARAALRVRGLWERLPDAVRRHLSAPEPQATPMPAARNVLVGSNALSVGAMVAAGAVAHPRPLTGDVADAAAEVLEAALALAPGQALAFGGETTVTLRGHGLGGRNQELALRVALAAAGRGLSGDWAFLAGGSDGRDGPTEAAGGLVDAGTAGRIAAAGLDPAALLADNDSNRALAAAGDLVVTGATGTNVADLAVFVRAGT